MLLKSMSTLSKVLIGTTAAMATATTMFAIHDKKVAKADCPCEDCKCSETDNVDDEE